MTRSPLRRPDDLKCTRFHGIVTASPKMIELFERLERVSRTHASVLVRGETGTGKELVARAIHALGPRSSGPFKAINCATLTPELLASVLFGHVRGAFTGAIRDRRGLFQLANRGTIFLDEIAELPLELQARLLRVLQERSFVPVGATEPVQIDVRVVSATHRALRDDVEHGRFREDLMYRIRVVPIFLPRLADRLHDVELLTWHFIDGFNREYERTITGVDPNAMDALLAYAWPGNVRELRNNIEYAFAIGVGETLTVDELTPELRGERPVQSSGRSQISASDLERERIVEALRLSRGRKGAAAEHLGISRSTLWRKLREHRIST